MKNTPPRANLETLGLSSVLLFSLAGAGLAALAGLLHWRSHRITPEERERQRRLRVNRFLRTVEGFLTDAGEETVLYSYHVAGVDYYASQDLRSLRASLSGDPSRFIGPVRVKFDPGNPANSIVVCEGWSGLPASADANKEQPAHGD